MAGRTSIGAKCIVSSLVIYAEITLVWTLYCAVLLCNVEFRWNVTLLFVYMLNLWLHMQNPHYRSYRAGTRNMMLTFDRRPIYRALTYIAVPFLGPQQPRYIGLTLYLLVFYLPKFLTINVCSGVPWNASTSRMTFPPVEMRMSLPSGLNFRLVHWQSFFSCCSLNVENGPWVVENKGKKTDPELWKIN